MNNTTPFGCAHLWFNAPTNYPLLTGGVGVVGMARSSVTRTDKPTPLYTSETSTSYECKYGQSTPHLDCKNLSKASKAGADEKVPTIQVWLLERGLVFGANHEIIAQQM